MSTDKSKRETKPATGTVEYVPKKKGEKQGHYKVRYTADDRSRPWVHLNPGPKSERAEKNAREYIADKIRHGELAGLVAPRRSAPEPGGESVSTYADRWFDDREARGYTSVGTDRGRFRKWVGPHIGPRPIAAVARLEIERLVEHLDAAVVRGAMAWRTAGNVWALVTKLFDDARRAKALAFRVREDNPCADVRGPDRGAKVGKVYVYPSDVVVLMSADAERVPLFWKRLYAVTTYLGLRAAEVRGVDWQDVDLEHRRVYVHRTVDDAGVEHSTKGEEARPVPIEPTLLPLLEAMHAEAKGKGRLFPGMLSECRVAPYLRRHLFQAGVERPELHTSTKTRRRLRFHDLRASYCTWRAVGGDEPLRIMQAAGHKDFETTMAYIRTADQVRDGFGTPFPSLPSTLLEAGESSEIRPGEAKSSEDLCRRRESKPANAARSAESRGDSQDPRSTEILAPRANAADSGGARSESSAVGTIRDDSIGSLDADLHAAIAAGRWALAEILAAELKARREERAGVVDLQAERARRASR